MSHSNSNDRMTRWRLILGGEQDGTDVTLQGQPLEMDRALSMLYGDRKKAGSGRGTPAVARWLGDIRTYFPASVVRIMQKDAMTRLNMRQLLLEPEMLDAVEPDVNLVANIISLGSVIPEETKETARMVVRKVADELMRRLAEPMRAAVTGAIHRGIRNRRPRLGEIDWPSTIRANLKHYQPAHRTIVPETLIGFGRKSRRTERDIILAIDQSGSMAESVVYSSIFGAVMASLPAVSTRLVVFDTEVVDLTEKLTDPVDVLFGVQLGGGTFINKAVAYCQEQIREPKKTIMVLISDLYEGGVEKELLRRAMEIHESGVELIVLLALSDSGHPCFDEAVAGKLSALGIPCFACSPDRFPDLMAAAIKREDIKLWAAKQEIVTH